MDKYRDYINAYYLSIIEAIYRIFSFKSIYKNPSIQCLPIYLEGRNLANIQQPKALGSSTITNLLWYFQRPSTDPFLQLTYMEFFDHYYLETLSLDDPLDHSQIPITCVNTK